MKKIMFFTIAMLLVVAGTKAQTNAQKARTILDKAAAVVSNKEGAQANYAMSGKLGSASGKILVKGNMFCAESQQFIIWYDGKTQWTYNKQAEEVNVSTPNSAQQQTMNPYNFIHIYKNGYKLSHTATAGGNVVRLIASDAKKSIKEMKITVSKQYVPTKVEMRTDKGWSTITLSQFKSRKLADSTFKFSSKDYPNAEVIDLR